MRAVVWLVVGLIIGIAVTLSAIMSYMPDNMITVTESRLGFEETVSAIEQGAAEAGWKVPKVYDIQKSLAADNYQIERLNILSVCSPRHAFTILSDDERKRISAMMPCRVSVFEATDGTVYIAQMNTRLMSKLFGGVIEETMGTVSEEMDRFLRPVLKTDN